MNIHEFSKSTAVAKTTYMQQFEVQRDLLSVRVQLNNMGAPGQIRTDFESNYNPRVVPGNEDVHKHGVWAFSRHTYMY